MKLCSPLPSHNRGLVCTGGVHKPYAMHLSAQSEPRPIKCSDCDSGGSGECSEGGSGGGGSGLEEIVEESTCPEAATLWQCFGNKYPQYQVLISECLGMVNDKVSTGPVYCGGPSPPCLARQLTRAEPVLAVG